MSLISLIDFVHWPAVVDHWIDDNDDTWVAIAAPGGAVTTVYLGHLNWTCPTYEDLVPAWNDMKAVAQ